jgi:uncharacterized DUF497 family protein
VRETHPTTHHQVISSDLELPDLTYPHLSRWKFNLSLNFVLALYAFCAYNCSVDFQWDSDKAKVNWKKHAVDFADAVGVFEDHLALTIDDQASLEELRWITLGTDFGGRLLVVVYTYRGAAIRIISARKATKKERDSYEGKRTGI